MDDPPRKRPSATSGRQEDVEGAAGESVPAGGLPESFAAFYQTHRPRLLRFVLWLGADLHRANDIVQDAMLAVYLRWQSVDHPYRYAQVTASHSLSKQPPVSEVPTDGVCALIEAEAEALDPAVLHAERAAVLAALRTLPRRQRQVLAWYYDGYVPADIGEILGLRANAVRVALHAARHALKNYPGWEGGDIDGDTER